MMTWFKLMWAKKVELLSSRKFWIATMGSIIAILKLDPITYVEILTIVQVWLGIIWSVGLIQGTAERIGGILKKR